MSDILDTSYDKLQNIRNEAFKQWFVSSCELSPRFEGYIAIIDKWDQGCHQRCKVVQQLNCMTLTFLLQSPSLTLLGLLLSE